ncbi:MAG: helix-turn-helix transcriptional regulator [bacterium]|nr:helix-turn-helix transcriptional regulator [bacterium]MDZ4248335.1 helix-turn-helix transcriptional regulator [Patescibacteria group bacterium]
MAIDEERFFNELSRRIAKARKSQSLSQEALEAKSNVDRVAIAYIEQGHRKPTVTTVYRLSKGLGIKLENLFKGY